MGTVEQIMVFQEPITVSQELTLATAEPITVLRERTTATVEPITVLQEQTLATPEPIMATVERAKVTMLRMTLATSWTMLRKQETTVYRQCSI